VGGGGERGGGGRVCTENPPPPPPTNRSQLSTHPLYLPTITPHNPYHPQGSYIKMAQYISSRADIVPDAFSDELSALQDAVPPSSLAEVRGECVGVCLLFVCV
jgi:hypothetical protein